ncbi:MAG: ParB/RepB/Spo0J family partition protein [Alphaproteobacteria bacterium]|nr:ParB/RepB/Spo0J family partition protein [Alphaproteobacteria bacterium]
MNAPTKQKGLGKGLSALMGDTAPVSPTRTSINRAEGEGMVSDPQDAAPMPTNELPIGDLRPGKYQPRRAFKPDQLQELADSIARNGIMQPIVVRAIDGGNYEIVAGERRWRAAKLADLKTVPVLIRDLSDSVALELAIVENVQRSDLTPIEESAGYQRLMDEFSYTQEELAEVVGKSRSHVANLLRLQNLPEEIKEMLDNGELTMGHARALIGVADAVKLAQDVVTRGLNVRQTEALTRRDPEKPIGRPKGATGNAPQQYAPQNSYNNGAKDPDIIALEDTLSENLGLKVSIDDRGQSGLISIQYTTLTQLDEVLRRLGGSF